MAADECLKSMKGQPCTHRSATGRLRWVASVGVFWLEPSLRRDPGVSSLQAYGRPDRVVDCAMLRKEAGQWMPTLAPQGVAFINQRLPSESPKLGWRGARLLRLRGREGER